MGRALALVANLDGSFDTLRDRVHVARAESPLFDTQYFVDAFQDAVAEAWQAWLVGGGE